MISAFAMFKGKSARQIAGMVLMYAVIGGWWWYGMWAMALSHDTILMDSVPEFKTYLGVGIAVGVLFILLGFRRLRSEFKLKDVFQLFIGGLGIGFVLSLNIYDVCIYCFPDKVIGYEAEYDVTFPGPSRGKHGHCEAGLIFRDQHTGKKVELCTSAAALKSQHKQGMTGVWVTAKVNSLGSYIVRYEFIYL